MHKPLKQLKTLLLDHPTGDVQAKKFELKLYFQNSWQTYESLFSLINDDSAYYLRPEPLRHPLIFYYGHTATFFINKLMLGKYISQRLNERLEAICAVGVDEMSWDDLNSAHYDWPSVDEVREYRTQVKELIEHLIDSMDLVLPITQDSLAWVLLMGCEHERIHLETSSVIIRMLDLQYLQESEFWPCCEISGCAPLNTLKQVAGKTVNLAKACDDNTYGWDNEFGSKEVKVDSFKASEFLVSNQEFLAFIDAGGYQQEQWWCAEGKRWLAYSKACMPRFWLHREGQYYQRNLTNEMPLPLDWPVEVNYLEAKAFCNFKANQNKSFIRLPTEAEYQVLRSHYDGDLTTWSQAPGNTNLEQYASSCPVNCNSVAGFFDVIGNVWQWTESAIDGFDGFKVHPLYDDFSTPTFDGKHNLIKGGSWISTGNEAIRSSRYAFRRHFFQHAGFRYIESLNESAATHEVNRIENDAEVCQAIEEHFGATEFGFDNFSQAVVRLCLPHLTTANNKLLDLGCSVGRRSFELAQYFEHVDGVDFSARTIMHAHRLQLGKSVRYAMPNEGEIVDYKELLLEQCDLNRALNNIQFSQGDPCNLKSVFSDYDVVFAISVLEQLNQPKQFLANIEQRINSGGYLVLSCGYNWHHSIEEHDDWPTGMKVNGENVKELDGITPLLDKNFKLVFCQDVPRLVKLNQRQFHLAVEQVSIWQRA